MDASAQIDQLEAELEDLRQQNAILWRAYLEKFWDGHRAREWYRSPIPPDTTEDTAVWMAAASPEAAKAFDPNWFHDRLARGALEAVRAAHEADLSKLKLLEEWRRARGIPNGKLVEVLAARLRERHERWRAIEEKLPASIVSGSSRPNNARVAG